MTEILKIWIISWASIYFGKKYDMTGGPSTIATIYHVKFLGIENSKHALIVSILRILPQLFLLVILGTLYGIYGIAFALVIASSISAIYAVYANQIIKNNKS